ncbi:linear primary-alkylsulfatase-like [Styela clava]
MSDNFEHIKEPLAKITDQTYGSKKLVEFTKNEFLPRQVFKVGDNVYSAVGWALANSIMIEGKDGIIIIDTTESMQSMQEIMVEFRKITSKPVKAIIYTHFHGDHHIGTHYVIDRQKTEFPDINIEIYGHETTAELYFDTVLTREIGHARSTRQFAILHNDVPNTGKGIGPFGSHHPQDGLNIYMPTRTFSDKAKYNVAGIEFELIHTPGETPDQITVWLPKEEVAMPGDNIYKTFPNLYAIRGSPPRNVRMWYQSLDKTRVLKAKYLVGSHTRPVIGKDEVYETLTVYRDAIKYIHDQTLRLINKGYYPGQIVANVKLPDLVAQHPFLQEHYGTVAWSVKSVFNDYLGWFSGNPQDLHPMTENERATRMARLITYAQSQQICAAEVMLREAEISHKKSYEHYLSKGKYLVTEDKWALELVDTVLQLGSLEEALSNTARQVKISALRALGVEEISANGRNYYLTCALELESNISLDQTKKAISITIKRTPIEKVLEMLSLKVKGLECQHQKYTIGLTFLDLDKDFILTLRNSVCDVIEAGTEDENPQVRLTMRSDVYKSIMNENKNWEEEVKAGNVTVASGALETYMKFLKCFDPLNYD